MKEESKKRKVNNTEKNKQIEPLFNTQHCQDWFKIIFCDIYI